MTHPTRSGSPRQPHLSRYRGISREHTESDLRQFLDGCATRSLAPLTVTRNDLELYVRWMQDIRRLKPSTVSRRTSVVSCFYRTCVIDGRGALTAARTSANPNDFALICLLGLLGLREFEATGISLNDLGEEHGHRVVRVHGKGGTVVLVPLPPAVSRAVDRGG